MFSHYLIKPLLIAYLLFFVCFSVYASPSPSPSYYQPRSYGSDALYSPFSNFLSYIFDTLQVPDSFSTDNFSQNNRLVFDHLSHPDRAIQNEGGYQRFVNRNIFPVLPAYSNESYAILPNYFLHTLGGGMAYRKDLEWFRAHDYNYATTSAVVLAMTAEYLQEVLEKNTTTDDDEVADVFIFRPIGLLLFHNDKVADFIMQTLDPAIWPSLQVYDLTENRINNAGIFYIYRPPITEFYQTRLFVFTGLNTMFGLSHRINASDSISWGIGRSIQKIDLAQDQLSETHDSAGIFYDRNKSLIASLVINDTGGNRFRFNWYPVSKQGLGQLGYFLSQNANNSWSAGLIYKIQLGIGFTVK